MSGVSYEMKRQPDSVIRFGCQFEKDHKTDDKGCRL